MNPLYSIKDEDLELEESQEEWDHWKELEDKYGDKDRD